MAQASVSYAFLTEGEFDAPPLHLLCLVREFDLGQLAGQLLGFKLLEASVTRTLSHYTSSLPWPFQPRWVCAAMRFGVVQATGAVVSLGQSLHVASPAPAAAADATPAPPPGATRGTVHYSFYHIQPLPAQRPGPGPGSGSGPARCRLRRIINVDMHVCLPRPLLRSSLTRHYAGDGRLIEAVLAGWEGSGLQRRLAEGECYRAMERAMEEAKKEAEARGAGAEAPAEAAPAR
ncbi:hypothetical protein GPECTOR_270g702 [Gonium pectorale]|uniref:Uncharacterized protein n=1 Tax=Gonium pectorale TaxID=33097 RepID=A0A150FW81_GONPE|nr:hypothetical protein GPECTOR_270g702 [Gonium pectorale]|eukprot:KXZ41828.1 hypothetical protein GPECTOR_270g702 [Gonium pectorale]